MERLKAEREMYKELYEKTLKQELEYTKRTDAINKRLVTACIVVPIVLVIAFAISAGFWFNLYFTADYSSYPSLNQNQTGISIGGDE